jgi:hypothetical protein
MGVDPLTIENLLEMNRGPWAKHVTPFLACSPHFPSNTQTRPLATEQAATIFDITRFSESHLTSQPASTRPKRYSSRTFSLQFVPRFHDRRSVVNGSFTRSIESSSPFSQPMDLGTTSADGEVMLVSSDRSDMVFLSQAAWKEIQKPRVRYFLPETLHHLTHFQLRPEDDHTDLYGSSCSVTVRIISLSICQYQSHQLHLGQTK